MKHLCYNCESPATKTINHLSTKSIMLNTKAYTTNIPCCDKKDCVNKIRNWLDNEGELDCEKVTDSK